MSEAERVLLHIASGLLWDKRQREQAEWRELAPPQQSKPARIRSALRRWLGLTRREDRLADYRRIAAIRENDRLTEEYLQAIGKLLSRPDDLPRIGPALLPPGLNDPPSA